MYEKNQKRNIVVWQEFEVGVRDFINWAKNQHAQMNGDKIRCPCRKYKNRKCKTTDEVMYDIYMKGFVDGYYNWTAHGEVQVLENYDEQFFDVVHAANQPLYSGCHESQLTAVAELDGIDMEYYKFCCDPRYKPIRDRNPHRKKSSYIVLSHVTEEGSMCRPSDVEAWRHFDRTHPKFVLEPRNVRLGLCIDGFAPHG
ncbi:UNVERIFIED_CONTAM: hypothetical protein Slati_0495200 [Sesamum latifolium]|uniref:Transposase-associated domain-containing protein n=1 Tax=Sesamum latifolium TaxID=2727402 RepID=A0AAW2XXF4_9LAMI